MKKQNIRMVVYEAIGRFIAAYKQNDMETLLSKYGLDEENIAEIDSFLDFVEDKSKIHLFPISDIDKNDLLSIDKVGGDYLIECILTYEDTDFYLVCEYNKMENDRYGFEYRCFDI